MEHSEEFESIPFAKVIETVSGKKILAVSPQSSPDNAIIASLASILDECLAELNRENSPVRGLRRINEASRFFEEAIASLANAHADFRCEYPKTAAGNIQRSGYPDLMLTHIASGRICYLDPKLFESSSRASTLRTFYYQPKPQSGKVHHDAHHLLVGIEHDGNDGAWEFTGWELVDLADSHVRLKAEFQGSNRDIYRDELILRRSAR
ncbi:MAG: hypothetical protein VCA55_15155 [Verrucomicrobiales bacterium]